MLPHITYNPRIYPTAFAPQREGDPILAIDFGTTQSSLAFVRRNGQCIPDPQSILTVKGFSGDELTMRLLGEFSDQVPSQIAYCEADASEGEDQAHSAGDDNDNIRHVPRGTLFGFECAGLPTASDALTNDPRKTRIEHLKLSLDHSEKTQKLRDPVNRALHALTRIPRSTPPQEDILSGSHANNPGYSVLASDKDQEHRRTPVTRARARANLEANDVNGHHRNSSRDKSNHPKTILGSPEDALSDYLTRLLREGRDTLRASQLLGDDEAVEIVFTVPVCWKSSAYGAMQKAILNAAKASGLRLPAKNPLFMLTEPEAAATYILANHPTIQVNPFLMKHVLHRTR